jgi:glycosyltransferase involved in cell wall biosynthesis
MDLSRYDWMSRLENWMCRKLAPFTDRIVLNSHAGARYHLGLGFPADKITVIENGIDTDKFRFDSLGREKLRSEWGVRPSDLLIGLPARLDPMKDHITALRAFANLRHQFPAAKLVCVGSGPLAHSLPESSRALGLDGAVIWAGLRLDMAHAYSALDVSSSSSSWGEGFSNTTAEAMACERACVVTDVGDSAAIVGDTGWVVPARSPEALSAAWREALHMTVEERQIRGAKARKRVEEKFSVTQMVTRTVQVLKSSGDFST